MNVDRDLPDIRPVPELLHLMERIAVECGRTVDAQRATALFEESVGLALEIRVPHMPDTDEELARMLAQASDGPTYTTGEVMAHLEASRRRHDRKRREFHEQLASQRWHAAATMLMPGADPMIPWEGYCEVTFRDVDGEHVASARHLDAVVECTSAERGLALLGLVMRLHRWRDLWMR